jgi:GT2 family glycosyltransferase
MSTGLTLQPGELSKRLETDPPVAVRLVDLDGPLEPLQLPQSRSGKPYRQLLAMLRQRGRPLGWTVLPVGPGGEVSLADLGNQLDGSSDGRPGGAPGPAAARGEEDLPDQLITVVIATCACPERVIPCVEAIQAGATGRFEVVVVENRPGNSNVKAELRSRFGEDEDVRYVEELRPGLSAARNAGLEAARGDLVAFTDDDVRVDSAWIPSIRSAFAASPEVTCVTGLILPLELETPAQLLDERFASYAKGYERRTYSIEFPPDDQPLFPYAAGHFASGANMAFRTEALRGLRGFDPVLSTGTPSRGGEDLDVCVRVLHAGGHLTYEPGAIVWHRHPDTYDHVRRQVFDYGAGLGAMLTKHLITGSYRWQIVRRVPGGLRYYVHPDSRKNEMRGTGFPPELVRRERAGLLYGPLAYAASRLDSRRKHGGC